MIWGERRVEIYISGWQVRKPRSHSNLDIPYMNLQRKSGVCCLLISWLEPSDHNVVIWFLELMLLLCYWSLQSLQPVDNLTYNMICEGRRGPWTHYFGLCIFKMEIHISRYYGMYTTQLSSSFLRSPHNLVYIRRA